MQIAKFEPKNTGSEQLEFKAYQNGPNSYSIALRYNGEFMWKTEYASFDDFATRWQQIKNSYDDNSRSSFAWSY